MVSMPMEAHARASKMSDAKNRARSAYDFSDHHFALYGSSSLRPRFSSIALVANFVRSLIHEKLILANEARESRLESSQVHRTKSKFSTITQPICARFFLNKYPINVPVSFLVLILKM